MANTQVTRCPHCQTTFRIRLEQLAVAKGAVRCGSCLQVFKAIDHLVPATAASAAAKSTATKPKVTADHSAQQLAAKKAAQKAAAAKKAALHKAEQEKQLKAKKLAQAKAQQAAALKAAAQKAEAQKKAAKPAISFDDIPDQINDDPLEDLGIKQPEKHADNYDIGLQLDDSVFSMQEDVKPSRYSLHQEKSEDLDLDFIDEFSDKTHSPYQASDAWADELLEEDTADNSSPNQDSDESWADALLNEDQNSDLEIEEIDMSFAKANVAIEEDDFRPSLEDEEDVGSYHLGGDPDADNEVFELEIADPLDELHEDPLSLDKKGKAPTSSAGFWLWSVASLLLLFLLTGQTAYFKFDDWARHPSYRPVYAISCSVIGCQLPAVQDVSKIATQHFVVRSHTDIEQALAIDTLLVNNADYVQPFPDVTVSFTGLNEQIIASRKFRPQEYLAGELAGAESMPIRTPVHISIEILDPGPEAVGYSINLAANH